MAEGILSLEGPGSSVIEGFLPAERPGSLVSEVLLLYLLSGPGSTPRPSLAASSRSRLERGLRALLLLLLLLLLRLRLVLAPLLRHSHRPTPPTPSTSAAASAPPKLEPPSTFKRLAAAPD